MSEESKTATQHKTKEISLSDVFSKAWELFNKNLSVWVGVGLVVVIPSVILGLILSTLLDVDATSFVAADFTNTAAVAGGVLITGLVVALYQIILSAILVTVYIKSALGAKLVSVGQTLGLGKEQLAKVLVAMIVCGIIIGIGLLILIVPGIVALFLLAFTPYVVADTDKSLGEAISQSVEYAKEYFVQMFLIGLVFLGVSILISIVVGMFSGLPDVLYTLVSTAVSTAFQIYIGLAGAVFYLEVKKRSHKS